MTVIAIGKKYKDAFNGIYTLVRSGKEFAPNDISVKEDALGVRSILRGDFEFRYTEDASRVSQNNVELYFDGEGASWFKNFRGAHGGVESGMAEWIKTIDDVSAYYHRAFSFIEYKQTKKGRSTLDMERGRQMLERCLSTFLPQISGYEIAENRSEDNFESIYGITLKLDVNGGAGMSQPILGKVFFRSGARGLTPISDVEAQEIDQSIRSALTEGGKQSASDDADDKTIDEILSAFDKLLKNEARFADALTLGEQDEEVVEDILSQSSRGNLSLEVTGVKTLGISHVRWENSAFVVLYEGRKVLRAVVGMDGAISLICLNCKSQEVLVEKNRVLVTVNNDSGKEITESVLLLNQEGMGLEDDMLEAIKLKFSEHLSNPCREVKLRSGSCGRLVCKSDMRNFGSAEEPIWKCGDCPHPEVIFSDGSLNKQYTPSLAFARDKLALIDKRDVVECAECHRTFSKEYMMGDICRFCGQTTIGARGAIAAKARYKKYSKLFSTSFRLRNARKKKQCFEQEDMILFVIGGTKYLFNKTEVNATGYITPPKKVVRRSGSKK